jgi:poly-D-alanine transfer protein DltD
LLLIKYDAVKYVRIFTIISNQWLYKRGNSYIRKQFICPISQNKQTYKHMLNENIKREIKVYDKIMLEVKSTTLQSISFLQKTDVEDKYSYENH